MRLVYKCDHCGDTAKDTITMAIHERTCKWDDANRCCTTCEHLKPTGYGDTPMEKCAVHMAKTDPPDEKDCTFWNEWK